MYDLLDYLRWHTSVPTKLNEMAILIVGRQWRSQVEWFAHAWLAKKAGLADSIIADLKANKRPTGMLTASGHVSSPPSHARTGTAFRMASRPNDTRQALESTMARVVKRSAANAAKGSASRRRPYASLPLPRWIPPQLCQLVEIAPSGPQWLHEIKLDGFRMSARIERGRVQLLTRTGLDWSDKYPSVIAALAKVRAKTSYLDGELCGIGDDGLPSFSQTQAATDGSRGMRLVYYVFDLLHLDGARHR